MRSFSGGALASENRRDNSSEIHNGSLKNVAFCSSDGSRAEPSLQFDTRSPTSSSETDSETSPPPATPTQVAILAVYPLLRETVRKLILGLFCSSSRFGDLKTTKFKKHHSQNVLQMTLKTDKANPLGGQTVKFIPLSPFKREKQK